MPPQGSLIKLKAPWMDPPPPQTALSIVGMLVLIVCSQCKGNFSVKTNVDYLLTRRKH